jgi:hypothetical protein
LAVDRPDPDHSQGEDRFLCIGRSYVDRLLVVSYAERGERIRIISARVAAPSERRSYEQPRQMILARFLRQGMTETEFEQKAEAVIHQWLAA